MGTGGRKDRGQGSHQGLYSEVSQAWISILALLLIHRMASGRWINFWVPWSLNDRKYTSPTEVSWDYLFCWACIFLIFCYVSKAMAPHFSTLAWKIPWTEERSRLQSMGSLESDTTERLHFHFSLSCIGKGNGNPLQCSCLENPMDREAW